MIAHRGAAPGLSAWYMATHVATAERRMSAALAGFQRQMAMAAGRPALRLPEGRIGRSERIRTSDPLLPNENGRFEITSESRDPLLFG